MFAHPDDESLAAGGLLACTAAAGGRTGVVTATWAEGTHRAEELAVALHHLGAGEPRLLGYSDARVPDSAPGQVRLLDAELDEAAELLATHLRSFRPDAVVTHDRYGGLTGHPDHVRTHRVTIRALELVDFPIALRLATHPDSAVPGLAGLIGARRTRCGVPDDEVTTRLDVTDWLEQKVAAILAHRSEVTRGALPGLIQRLSPAERANLLGTEWYVDVPLAESSPSVQP